MRSHVRSTSMELWSQAKTTGRHIPFSRYCGRDTAHEILVFIASRDTDDFEVFSMGATSYPVMARFGLRSQACVAFY